MDDDLGRVGRQGLLDLVRQLRAEVVAERALSDDAIQQARTQLLIEGCLTCRGGEAYQAMLANLSSVQERCNELFFENRRLRGVVDD